MANNIKTKKNVQEEGVNILDLFFYLLSYWYVFVICVAVCVGYQMYKYSKSTFVYRAPM